MYTVLTLSRARDIKNASAMRPPPPPCAIQASFAFPSSLVDVMLLMLCGCEHAQNESIVFVFRYICIRVYTRQQAARETHGEHARVESRERLLISRYDFLLGRRCAKQSRGFGVNGTERTQKILQQPRNCLSLWLMHTRPGLEKEGEIFAREGINK